MGERWREEGHGEGGGNANEFYNGSAVYLW
jgi:hypothetical protein